MILEIVVREAIEQGLTMFYDFVNEENADDILERIDSVENHKLLQENRAYVITKVGNKINLYFTSNDNIAFDKEPITVNMMTVLDTMRKHCNSVKEKANKS